MNILTIFRSIFYNIFIVVWTIFVGTLFLPGLLFPKNNILLKYASKLWTGGLYLALKLICNLKAEIRGQENIPKAPFVVAAKHQSALEIIMLLCLLDSPKFILRSSLIYVPFMGLYCYKMGMIYIDRDGGAKTLKSMLKKTKIAIENNESIIIFT